MSEIVACRIHPGIGIARVGDSVDGWFIGQEAPGQVPDPPGGFKDATGHIKRQAARFRVIGVDADGRAVAELAGPLCRIRWRAHLVNAKGAWYRFVPAPRDPARQVLRNWDGKDSRQPLERTELVIDPGPREVEGPSRSGVMLDGGSFLGLPVGLGELRTDAQGRLLVLGGSGRSGSVAGAGSLDSAYNNDGWHDDTADGTIQATVTLADGRVLEALPARVLVAPPDYAPAIDSVVTLYERIAETTGVAPGTEDVRYWRDIHPLLLRFSRLAWVNGNAARGHGPAKPGDFATNDALRQMILGRMRKPPSLATPEEQKLQATWFFMPQLGGDGEDPVEGQPLTWLSLLPSQYRLLEAWAQGRFTTEPEPLPPPLPLDALPIGAWPAALDRGALEPCVGGPFCPGIEMSYDAEDPATFAAPFRVRADLPPGALVGRMAVPWQADFFECSDHWWPAQRPDDVVPEAVLDGLLASRHGLSPPQDGDDGAGSTFFGRGVGDDRIPAALAYRTPWARGLPTTDPDGDDALARHWSELGFVVGRRLADGTEVFVERQRNPVVGDDVRELFHRLLNIDSHPEVLPAAAGFVERCLVAARATQRNPETPPIWWSFAFTPEALDARLMEFYNDLTNNAARYDPTSDPLVRSREQLTVFLHQWAPFNLTDGAWLSTIHRAGPMDEVKAALFRIMMDEMGDGDVTRAHANLARDLYHEIGIYPPPITSRAFAEDPSLLSSAFTVPAFALAISQFPERYLPELIGMTLFLEWNVLDLKPSIALLRHYKVDPHFYVLHVGIDNAVNGHGHLARQAVLLHLDQARRSGGDELVQQQWRRIWDGFVAYGTTGTLGQDLARLLGAEPDPRADMLAMIGRKRPFGSLNHGDKMLGANRINDWFSDPEGFLDALVTSGKIVPGDPDSSPLLALMSFDSGPMYNVFAPDEIELWRRWITSLAAPRQAMATRRRQRAAGDAGPVRNLWLTSPRELHDTHPTGRILGMGAVH